MKWLIAHGDKLILKGECIPHSPGKAFIVRPQKRKFRIVRRLISCSSNIDQWDAGGLKTKRAVKNNNQRDWIQFWH